jgi:hypothetical protein
MPSWSTLEPAAERSLGHIWRCDWSQTAFSRPIRDANARASERCHSENMRCGAVGHCTLDDEQGLSICSCWVDVAAIRCRMYVAKLFARVQSCPLYLKYQARLKKAKFISTARISTVVRYQVLASCSLVGQSGGWRCRGWAVAVDGHHSLHSAWSFGICKKVPSTSGGSSA